MHVFKDTKGCFLRARAALKAQHTCTRRPEKWARDSRRSSDLPGEGKESVEMEHAKKRGGKTACLHSSWSGGGGGGEMATLIDVCLGEAAAAPCGLCQTNLLRPESWFGWGGATRQVSKVENGRRLKEGKTDPGPACWSSFLCTCTCAASSHSTSKASENSRLFKPGENLALIWGRSFPVDLDQWGGTRKSFLCLCFCSARADVHRKR